MGSSRNKALVHRSITWVEPFLVPLLGATVVLLVALACMFFLPYAVFEDPNGTDPGYGNSYLHDSLTLFAIAGLFAVLDIVAILRARHLIQTRPSIVVLPNDPTYHRSILSQQIPTGVALSAAWLAFNAVSAVAQGSWLHRAIAFLASVAVAALFIRRFRRSEAGRKV